MPTSTFERLDERKRDAITAAALRQFADHDFALASVSRIVAELGIAKGSIYQYFADKADLHAYVVAVAESRMRDALAQQSAGEPVEAGLFDVVRAQMRATVVAAARLPLESRVLERAYREGPATPMSDAGPRPRWLEPVRLAQRAGEIDAALDAEFAARIVEAVCGQVGPWLDARLPRNIRGRYEDPLVEEAFSMAITVLRSALGAAGDPEDVR